MRKTPFIPAGVIPACLLPFKPDMSIDEGAYRRHLEDILSVRGISAVTINGHASEVHAVTIDEQRKLLDLTSDVVGDRTAIVCGVFTNSSLEAGRIARMAEEGGADCLLVFPPDILSQGGDLRPEMIVEHLRNITDASGLPIILFQFPVASGLSYPHCTLLELCNQFPQIRAVKDMIGDGNRHEHQIRELKALDNPVNTLTTHSSWLLGSLSMGCAGVLSGAGSVIADLQVAIFEAVLSGDLNRAQSINDRIYPTVRAFYDPPLLDMHNRMKEALVILGRLENATVRPPLMKLSSAEIEKIRDLMQVAGLTNKSVYKNVA